MSARKSTEAKVKHKKSTRRSAPLNPYNVPQLPLSVYMEPELDAQEVVLRPSEAELLVSTMSPEYLPDEIFESEGNQTAVPRLTEPEIVEIQPPPESEPAQPEPEPETVATEPVQPESEPNASFAKENSKPPSAVVHRAESAKSMVVLKIGQLVEESKNEEGVSPKTRLKSVSSQMGHQSSLECVERFLGHHRNSLLDFVVELDSTCDQIGYASEAEGCHDEENPPSTQATDVENTEEEDTCFIGSTLQTLTALATLLVSVDDLGPYLPFEDMRPYFTLKPSESEGHGLNVKLKEMNSPKKFDIDPPPMRRSAPKITWCDVIEAIGYEKMDMTQVDPMIAQVLNRHTEEAKASVQSTKPSVRGAKESVHSAKPPTASSEPSKTKERASSASKAKEPAPTMSQDVVKVNEPVPPEIYEEVVRANIKAVTVPETNRSQMSITSSVPHVRIGAGQAFISKPGAFDGSSKASVNTLAGSAPETNLPSSYVLDDDSSIVWTGVEFGGPPALSILGMAEEHALSQSKPAEATAHDSKDTKKASEGFEAPNSWVDYYSGPKTSTKPKNTSSPNGKEKLADYFQQLNTSPTDPEKVERTEKEATSETLKQKAAETEPHLEVTAGPKHVELGKPLGEHPSFRHVTTTDVVVAQKDETTPVQSIQPEPESETPQGTTSEQSEPPKESSNPEDKRDAELVGETPESHETDAAKALPEAGSSHIVISRITHRKLNRSPSYEEMLEKENEEHEPDSSAIEPQATATPIKRSAAGEKPEAEREHEAHFGAFEPEATSTPIKCSTAGEVVKDDGQPVGESAGRQMSTMSAKSKKSPKLSTEVNITEITQSGPDSQPSVPLFVSHSKPVISDFIITYESQEIPLSRWVRSNKEHLNTTSQDYDDAEHEFTCILTEITDTSATEPLPITILDVNGQSVAISKGEAEQTVRPQLEKLKGSEEEVKVIKANLQQLARRGGTADGKIKKRDFYKFPKSSTSTDVKTEPNQPKSSSSKPGPKQPI